MMPESTSKQGKIVSIQLCPGHRQQMQMVDHVEARTNFGLKNDRHARSESPRQVLMIERETLDALGLKPGQVKENITTEGIELMGLNHEQRLRIGENVILEITKPCSPCSRMEEIRPGLLHALADKRGMLARVIHGGTIRRGDVIQPIDQ